MECKGENLLVGKWKFKVGDMPEVLESFHDDLTFLSKFEGTEHCYSGSYSFDTTVIPHVAEMEVKYSTLEKLPLGVYQSIFEINGNEFKSCTSMPGEQRPQEYLDNSIIAIKIEE